MTQGDGILKFRALFAERFEIDGYAEGCARLVLPGVAFADAATFVVESGHVWLQEIVDVARLGHQFWLVFEQWEDTYLDWRDPGMKAHERHRFLVALGIGLFDFREGGGDDCEGEAVETGGRLNDVRDVEALEEPFAPGRDLSLRHSACSLGALVGLFA